MKRLWLRILCKLLGHRRGKRMLRSSMPVGTLNDVIGYRCPRCHETWTRKITPKSQPNIPEWIKRSAIHEANRTRSEGSQ